MPDELTIRCGYEVAPGEYRDLLNAVSWRSPDAGDAQWPCALAATWKVTARTADARLVGLARVLDDGLRYASVWDVLVEPTRQRQGIGRARMAHVLDHTADRRLVSLIASAAGEALYRTLGFNERAGHSTALFLRHEAPTTVPIRDRLPIERATASLVWILTQPLAHGIAPQRRRHRSNTAAVRSGAMRPQEAWETWHHPRRGLGASCDRSATKLTRRVALHARQRHGGHPPRLIVLDPEVEPTARAVEPVAGKGHKRALVAEE